MKALGSLALSSSRKSSIFGDSDREPAEVFHLTSSAVE